MKVREVMTALPVAVAPDVRLAEAARRMVQAAVGSVLVVDDEDRLVGIVTDRDIALRGLGDGLDRDAKVAAVMSGRVVTVDAGDDVQAAYRVFRRTGVRRLPVLELDRAVGMLTVDDLFLDVFRALADLLGPLARTVLQEPSDRDPAGGTPHAL
ncbi:CBS domain-containing protein [Streptomyces sp. NPDC091215]|uniref:CBS domain-containing protein n=1 Tax=Streptomyces sp. NPDC091215 TaxID=3155192 RepID=UPI0034340968